MDKNSIRADDPVIEEIREIREKISRITEGFSDEQLLAWYQNEANKFMTPTVELPQEDESRMQPSDGTARLSCPRRDKGLQRRRQGY